MTALARKAEVDPRSWYVAKVQIVLQKYFEHFGEKY